MKNFIILLLILSLISLIISEKILYISIVSSINYYERRNTLRETWLKWVTDEIDYKFEVGVCEGVSINSRNEIIKENEKYNDVNIHYGMEKSLKASFKSFGLNNSYAFCGNEFLHRSSIMINYGRTYNFTHRYYMMIDDDGFLCLPTYLLDLMILPKNIHFFSGKYYCEGSSDHRADSNFMVFSTPIVKLFVFDWTNDQVLNFGKPKKPSTRRFFGREISGSLTSSTAVLFDDPRILWSTNKLISKEEILNLCLKGNIWFHKINEPKIMYDIFERSISKPFHGKGIELYQRQFNLPCKKSITSLVPNTNIRITRTGNLIQKIPEIERLK